MTLGPSAEVAYLRTLQLRRSKCQSNIRLAYFRGLTLAKTTINIKGLMIYVCEAMAFHHSIAAQNVNGACCTNRLKLGPWHGKIGWLHETSFHFLGAVNPKRDMTYFAMKIDIRVAPYVKVTFDPSANIIHFLDVSEMVLVS